MAKINLSSVTNLQNEVAATTTINNNNTLITQAIENTISRDGSLPNMMNSVLDMNSNKIINLPDAFTDQEPVTYGQFVEGITSVDSGVVVDGPYILAEHNDTTINDRVLAGSENIAIQDGGPKSDITVSISDPELNALADLDSDEDKLPYFTGEGTADVTDLTPFARTLLDDEDASTMRDTLGVTIGTDTQPHSDLLDSLNNSSNGLLSKTDVNTITPRTITGTSNAITVTNGNGVSGNPTINLPSTLTFTGKTVTGGTYSSPIINTPTGIVKGDVGLGNVDNTSDATKNTATATLTHKTINGPDNTLTNISNASLASSADSTIKSNISGSSSSPSDNTITAVLDKQFGSTRGSIVYRGASSWNALAPSTSGYLLKTNGSGADPSWVNLPGGGDLLSTNNLSDVASASTSRANLGALGGGLKSQTFTSSGTFTTTSTSNTSTVYRYRMVGGGGGGGGSNHSSGAAGGGGAGAYAEGTFTGIAPSTSITITVGSAGANGNTSGSNGSNGGSSSIGSPVSITTGGGGGGLGATTGNAMNGGGGGSVTGSPNILSRAGAPGNSGVGGNAGVSSFGGDGGVSALGSPGYGGRASLGVGALTNATGYGAGGGGGFFTSSNGSSGSAGIVIIEWFES